MNGNLFNASSEESFVNETQVVTMKITSSEENKETNTLKETLFFGILLKDGYVFDNNEKASYSSIELSSNISSGVLDGNNGPISSNKSSSNTQTTMILSFTSILLLLLLITIIAIMINNKNKYKQKRNFDLEKAIKNRNKK